MPDKAEKARWLYKAKRDSYDPNEKVGETLISERMIDGMVRVFNDAKQMNAMAYVMVKLPGQPKPEIILNYPDSLDNKLSYYSKAYNDDGTLKSNLAIKIIGMGTVPPWFGWEDLL